jgi:hypothetical protein
LIFIVVVTILQRRRKHEESKKIGVAGFYDAELEADLVAGRERKKMKMVPQELSVPPPKLHGEQVIPRHKMSGVDFR